MSNVLIQESTMLAIADAIRSKTGSNDKILPADMPERIGGIETGTGGVRSDVSMSTSWNMHNRSVLFTAHYTAPSINITTE